MTSKTKPTPPPQTHKSHPKHTVRGNWGPHTAKQICVQCDNAFVQWVSTKRG